MLRSIGFGIPVLPDGALYIFADASRFTENSHDFAFELLEKAGVAVTPGVDFGEAGRRSIRFTYANSEENIHEAARRLAIEDLIHRIWTKKSQENTGQGLCNRIPCAAGKRIHPQV